MAEPSSSLSEAIWDEISSSVMAECCSSWAFSAPCGVGGSVILIDVPGSEEIRSGGGMESSGITMSSVSSLRGLLRR